MRFLGGDKVLVTYQYVRREIQWKKIKIGPTEGTLKIGQHLDVLLCAKLEWCTGIYRVST